MQRLILVNLMHNHDCSYVDITTLEGKWNGNFDGGESVGISCRRRRSEGITADPETLQREGIGRLEIRSG